MSIQMLREYIDLCEQFNVEPTLSGVSRYKQNLPIIKQLSQEDLQSVLFDVIALL